MPPFCPRPLARLLLHVLTVGAIGTALSAQKPVPDLTQGGAIDEHHDWQLGPTGARGWIWGHDLETTHARQIAITAVAEGTPAHGTLRVGDVIVGIDGAPFATDARRAFGAAITRAESTQGKGQLALLRWRAGKTEPVTLRLPVLGDYDDRDPAQCKKTQRIVDAAVQHLLQQPLRDDVPGLVNALALLATGRADCLTKVRAFAHELAPADLKLELAPGMVAWTWGMTGVFLAEYHLATGDAKVLPAIRAYATAIARGQSGVGTWGHGMSLPQHQGALGGYGAINQSGLGCWLALVLAQACGVDDAVVQQAIERSRRFFAFYANKGSIPYGDHPPYFFLHDNNGKNALAAITFDLLGDDTSARFFARMSTAAYAEREFGHTGNYFSYLWGPLGVARCGLAAVGAHLHEQRWCYDLARGPDGRFPYQGGAAADDSYAGWDATGVFLLTCSLPLQKLHITGKGTRTANTLAGAELAAVIDCGRPFDAWHMHDSHVDRPRDELLGLLGSWSPTVRYRAASALAKKREDVVPQLVAMLGSADRDTRYGACQALERIGKPAAAAVDALVAQLEDPDAWLQIRAAFALAEIGKPARKAVPKLLQLTLAGTPGDPRETARRYLGLSLFLADYVDNLPRRGLLAESFADVDRTQLLRTIRLLLTVDDGMVRWHMGKAFDKLAPEELDTLWPDILAAVGKPAPSGEMFGNEIRMAGIQLLAKQRIGEGMRAIVDYARTQNPWASENRMALQMEALVRYGKAAQPLLPELRELRRYCEHEPDFPEHCRKKKVVAVDAAIAAITAAQEQPVLRWLGQAPPAPANAPPDAPAPRKPGDDFEAWRQQGTCWLLTTKDGADLPADAIVENFPVLLRLDRAFFDFQQAQPRGEDLRIRDANGATLAHEIEQWDAQAGTASVWVRVPSLRGDARQPLHLHWGNATAKSTSDGGKVFAADNGFVSVLHLDPSLRDTVGTVRATDQGTQPTAGMAGEGRRFDGRSGIQCGEAIEAFPKGAGTSSTEAWFRAEHANTTVLAWGKEQRPGKVMLNLLSPPRVAIQCYFADVEAKSPLALHEWTHVVHTYAKDDSRVYVNGVLQGASTPRLDIPGVVRFDLGGWHGHGFTGDLDEVRISNVVRSPAWVRLCHENQKPLQTLVGPLVVAGDTFAASVPSLEVREGASATVKATAGGAQKVYWRLLRDGQATTVAVDRFEFTLHAGRVTGDQTLALQFVGVFPQETRTLDIPVTIREHVPDPVFTLTVPPQWDGRHPLRLSPSIDNYTAMQGKSAVDLHHAWRVDGVAAVRITEPKKVLEAGMLLVLERAMGSGPMTVTLTLDNGGTPVTRSATIQVTEPARDAWVPQPWATDEQPADHQFYARDDRGVGTLVWRGELPGTADRVFLRVLADGKPFATADAKVGADRCFDLKAALEPGLVHYRAELVTETDGRETVVLAADDLVCGDALLVDGQSNAEATDVGKDDPPLHSEWVRTFGCMGDGDDARSRVWGPAVCRAREGRLQVGYWPLLLGTQLVEAHRMPICILNGAVGGTRIDQHQRDEADPENRDSIYGRLLWRARAARLTHGIRAVLWHQGENDQGAAGPSGRWGHETWHDDFVAMAGGWQRDYPNVQHRYVFQIWPHACSMGSDGSDDMLRDVQRRLSRSFAKLSVMSTLGIEPPGGCHYPLDGYAQFARLIRPLVDRDLYGVQPAASITAPDLRHARFASAARDAIELEFDQPVVFVDALADQFHLGGDGKVVGGTVAGNVLRLRLDTATRAPTITYLRSRHWKPGNVLRGTNGIAALTFCNVAIEETGK